jgi:hypothetical protein
VAARDKHVAPGEFLYWQNLDQPWAKRLRKAGRLLLGFDPAPPDDIVATIASMYYDADPLAEAFVDEIYIGRSPAEGRAMLDQAIAGGVESVADAPESLLRLFEDIESPPAWVDPALVELGARVFRRWGTAVFRFAGSITLEAYSESSVAKPLALTGAYAGESTRNRFLETAAFWIAVSEPGGLLAGAPGRASALQVRIMHVFVRNRLLDHPEWDTKAWGVPISQSDALLTLMGGSFVPGMALRMMGYRPTKREIEAAMHFWRYVGHIMGVRPRWYPQSLKEAWQLIFVATVKSANRAGDDERELCQSYAKAFAPDASGSLLRRARAEWEHRVHLGYTRLFVSPRTHRKNRLPAAGPWALYPIAKFPLRFAIETLRRRLAAVDNATDRAARRRRNRWFAYHMGGRTAEYQAAPRFTR